MYIITEENYLANYYCKHGHFCKHYCKMEESLI